MLPDEHAKSTHDSSAETGSNEHISRYSLPHRARAIDNSLLSNLTTSEVESVFDNVITSNFSSSEIKAVLLASMFRLFLDSNEYRDWLDKQGELVNAALDLAQATCSGDSGSRLG